MNILKCPYCGVRLGQFAYADACPECHRELLDNTRILRHEPVAARLRYTSWPFRALRSVRNFIES